MVRVTGVRPLGHQPTFLRVLDEVLAREERRLESLVRLFFAIVSETLITGTLVRLPRDETVQPAVRALAADHAADEGKHHAYFKDIFEAVWPRLPRQIRQHVGVLLPEMLGAFLAPDRVALGRLLSMHPETFPDADGVATEIVTDVRTRRAVQAAAQPTIRMLASNGVFDEPEIVDAFALRGFDPDIGLAQAA